MQGDDRGWYIWHIWEYLHLIAELCLLYGWLSKTNSSMMEHTHTLIHRICGIRSTRPQTMQVWWVWTSHASNSLAIRSTLQVAWRAPLNQEALRAENHWVNRVDQGDGNWYDYSIHVVYEATTHEWVVTVPVGTLLQFANWKLWPICSDDDLPFLKIAMFHSNLLNYQRVLYDIV